MSSHPDQTVARSRRPPRSVATTGSKSAAGALRDRRAAAAGAAVEAQFAAGTETMPALKWWQMSTNRRGFADGRPVNLPLMALIIALHLVVLSLVAESRIRMAAKPTPTLVVFDVKQLLAAPALPPPPEPAARMLAEPTRPVIVPPPIVPPPIVPPAAPTPIAVVAQPPPPPAPSPPAPPSTVAGNDLSATMLSAEPPRYPVESRRKREEGTVVLALLVGIDGRVATISVQQSSGFPRLDSAALSAVKRWKWTPRTIDGTPVQVRGLVEIPFVLKRP
ncbi:MAG: periplasmic protein TonB [Alphaproteobacteria bacterium]|nr:periplasmic protein TonB [Alphaproteobacteria bacterium]